MMMGVDTGCLFRWISGPGRFAWSNNWWPVILFIKWIG